MSWIKKFFGRPLKLTVNKNLILEVRKGESLFHELYRNKIFIPSTCGGSGTCALCKCVVNSGGGVFSKMEELTLSEEEKNAKIRLSCQVKLNSNIEIEVANVKMN